MKKSDFKKLLKKEKHPIMKGQIYEIIFVTIFILLCALLLILQNKNILPSNIGLILIGIMVIIGLPYFIIDLKRDKKIKDMYEHYKKESKILDIKDNSKKIKIILITEIICSLILGIFIFAKYVEYPKANTESYKVNLKDGKVVKLEDYNFDNDNFSLKIPTEFIAMDEDMINIKYPNENPPSYVLTNDKTTINIAINITNTPLNNSQIKNYMKLMEAQLSSIAQIIDTRFFERDGHEVGEIKFISKAIDTDIYNHMIAFSDNGYLRIISFNCTKELQEIWRDAGEYIITSLAFK